MAQPQQQDHATYTGRCRVIIVGHSISDDLKQYCKDSEEYLPILRLYFAPLRQSDNKVFIIKKTNKNKVDIYFDIISGTPGIKDQVLTATRDIMVHLSTSSIPASTTKHPGRILQNHIIDEKIGFFPAMAYPNPAYIHGFLNVLKHC